MKQFIGKLRAWKKAYDVFPSMAADREFQEILDSALSQERLGEVVITEGVMNFRCIDGCDMPSTIGKPNKKAIDSILGKRGQIIFREQEGK